MASEIDYSDLSVLQRLQYEAPELAEAHAALGNANKIMRKRLEEIISKGPVVSFEDYLIAAYGTDLANPEAQAAIHREIDIHTIVKDGDGKYLLKVEERDLTGAHVTTLTIARQTADKPGTTVTRSRDGSINARMGIRIDRAQKVDIIRGGSPLPGETNALPDYMDLGLHILRPAGRFESLGSGRDFKRMGTAVHSDISLAARLPNHSSLAFSPAPGGDLLHAFNRLTESYERKYEL